MPQINLTAQLQAYSKVPFYSDWVRDVTVQNGSYEPIQEIQNDDGTISRVAWVRALIDKTENKYQWYPIDISLADKELVDGLKLRILECEQALDSGLSSIYMTAPYFDKNSNNLVLTFYNKYGWINTEGIKEYSQTISLPSVYPDNTTIYKNIAGGGLLSLVNTQDNSTIRVIPNDSPVLTYDALNNPTYVQRGKYQVIGTFVDQPVSKWASNNLLLGSNIDKALYAHDLDIQDLKDIVQGKSGFLDPIDTIFNWNGTGNKEDAFNEFLIKEALNQLFPGIAGLDGSYIPDQTKVLYNNHVYVFIRETLKWQDSGLDTVVEASNSGILGVVTGDAITDFKVRIEEDGTMSVNALETTISSINENKVTKLNNTSGLDVAYIQTEEGNESYTTIAFNAVQNSIAKRKDDGSLECEMPAEILNNTVLNYKWYESQLASTEDIKKLWGVYK